jgi:predicted RNA polymerase sigma factor
MVVLNRAVAVAMVDGPNAGLTMLAPLLQDRRLRHHHRLHAVNAHLLEMVGRDDEARAEYAVAARLATSIPEQRYLNAKAAGAAQRPETW